MFNKFNTKLQTIIALSIMAVLLCSCGKNEELETTLEAVTETTQAVIATTTEAPPEADEEGFVVTEDYVTTISDGVNVRIDPEDSSPIYRILAENVELPRTGYNDRWTRVVVDNTDFYVETSMVTESSGNKDDEETTDEDEPTTEEEEIEKIVVIDPGKQGRANQGTEPVGPNSEELKECVSEGANGTVYDTKESEINLTYAKLLERELKSKGYTVILTRDSDDVNITNKERAELANESGATLFVRINMNYSNNSELCGVMAITMTAESVYNSDLYEESNKAARRILQGITENTETDNQGIFESDGFTAINWSEIPVVDIRLGYLSNTDNETKLVSEEYQEKVVEGLAQGIDNYYSYR